MSTKAYSYARFSSKEQAEGDSLRRQLSAAYEYAEKHGLELDTSRSLQDHGVSAFTGANRLKGALGEFKKRVESGEIERGSYLLIDSLDRLSRETVTVATLSFLEIATAGINIVTLKNGRVFGKDANMADVMMAVIEIERSHEESANKGRNVAKAHAEAKRRAREEGRVWHSSGPKWLDVTSVGKRESRVIKFTPNTARVAIVQRVFDMMESGLGALVIAQRFNEEHLPTFRPNTAWNPSRVLSIARSRSVIGEYQPRFAVNGNRADSRPIDGDVIEGYYPEVIDRGQFLRVQAIITERNKKKGRKNGPKAFTNLFIGLIRCVECGGTIGVHTPSDSIPATWARKKVLRCGSAARKAPGPLRPGTNCTNRSRYPYDELEVSILARVTDFAIPTKAPKANTARDELAAALIERDDLNDKIEALLDLLEGGKAKSDPRMQARYDQRMSELAAKEQEIRKLKEAVGTVEAQLPPQARLDALQGLIEQLGSAEGPELYELRAGVSLALRGVIDQIDCLPNKDVHVIVGGGLKAYRFRGGEFLDGIDLGPRIRMEEATAARHQIEQSEDRNPAMNLRQGLTGGDEQREIALDKLLKA